MVSCPPCAKIFQASAPTLPLGPSPGKKDGGCPLLPPWKVQGESQGPSFTLCSIAPVLVMFPLLGCMPQACRPCHFPASRSRRARVIDKDSGGFNRWRILHLKQESWSHWGRWMWFSYRGIDVRLVHGVSRKGSQQRAPLWRVNYHSEDSLF